MRWQSVIATADFRNPLTFSAKAECQGPEHTLAHMHFALNDAVRMLSRTPGVLQALLADLPEAWTTPDYGPGTWSAREIVAHLIYGERTDWVPRLRLILSPGGPHTFEPFDRAGHKGLLASHGLAELLKVFEVARAESLASVRARGLSEGDLARTARHPALGEASASQLLSAWVVHDLNHIAQICKAMAFQYCEAVGPWEAYLSILSPPNPR